uniref:Uncharacterized protein n=1 Tax=Glossina palpalis gambiensis TaxID=67801 RepID=A0A1B0BHP9_9MUSC
MVVADDDNDDDDDNDNNDNDDDDSHKHNASDMQRNAFSDAARVDPSSVRSRPPIIVEKVDLRPNTKNNLLLTWIDLEHNNPQYIVIKEVIRPQVQSTIN